MKNLLNAIKDYFTVSKAERFVHPETGDKRTLSHESDKRIAKRLGWIKE